MCASYFLLRVKIWSYVSVCWDERRRDWAGARGRVIQADQEDTRGVFPTEVLRQSGPAAHWCLSVRLAACDGWLMRPLNLQSSCRGGLPPPLLLYWCYQTLSDMIKYASTFNYLWHCFMQYNTHTHTHREIRAPALLPQVSLLKEMETHTHTRSSCANQTVHIYWHCWATSSWH